MSFSRLTQDGQGWLYGKDGERCTYHVAPRLMENVCLLYDDPVGDSRYHSLFVVDRLSCLRRTIDRCTSCPKKEKASTLRLAWPRWATSSRPWSTVRVGLCCELLSEAQPRLRWHEWMRLFRFYNTEEWWDGILDYVSSADECDVLSFILDVVKNRDFPIGLSWHSSSSPRAQGDTELKYISLFTLSLLHF